MSGKGKSKERKSGMDLIRSFAPENLCRFYEFKSESETGFDGFIEFTENGKRIFLHVVNGEEYFDERKSSCRIPIENHYEFWSNNAFLVYGIVCDEDTAYFVSITDYLRKVPNERQTVSFPVMKINKLNEETFETIFKRTVLGYLPKLSHEQAIELLNSDYPCERTVAVKVLASRYADKSDTLNRLFGILNTENDIEVLSVVVRFIMATLLNKSSLMKESRAHCVELVKSIDEKVMEVLLSLTADTGITKGTIGQAVECIISVIPNSEDLLVKVIDTNGDNDIGVNAFLILSYYNLGYVIENKEFFISKLGFTAEFIINENKDFGCFRLY